MKEKEIKEAINHIRSRVNPAGADFEVVDMGEDGVIKLELKDTVPEVQGPTGGHYGECTASCSGCGISKSGASGSIPEEGVKILLEDMLKEEIPDLEKVEVV